MFSRMADHQLGQRVAFVIVGGRLVPTPPYCVKLQVCLKSPIFQPTSRLTKCATIPTFFPFVKLDACKLCRSAVVKRSGRHTWGQYENKYRLSVLGWMREDSKRCNLQGFQMVVRYCAQRKYSTIRFPYPWNRHINRMSTASPGSPDTVRVNHAISCVVRG